MVTAIFTGNKNASARDVWQYDYGQVLRIQGLKLPNTVEIHFSLQETGGTAAMRVGITKDGVTDVLIPDSMLENSDTTMDYPIFAFIYLTDAASGQTEYKIKIYVKSRPKPEAPGITPEPEPFHAAVQAVNDAANRAAESERQAEGYTHGRTDLPERAMDNAKYYKEEAGKSATEADRLAKSIAGVDLEVKKDLAAVQELTKQAQTSATNAGLSEQAAQQSETAAGAHRAAAETAENNAEFSEQETKKAEQATLAAKQLVLQMGQQVLDNKNHVDRVVHNFNSTAQQNLVDVNNAGQTQTKRVTDAGTNAVDDINTTKLAAKKEVIDEGTKQVNLVGAEGKKQLDAVNLAVQGIEADRKQIGQNAADITTVKNDFTKLENETTQLKSELNTLNQGGLILKDPVIAKNVQDWLNTHPEATTTVQDGSITLKKIKVGDLGYVTPEMFGAVGDGVADDSDAIERVLSSNKNIFMRDGAVYKICRTIVPNSTKIHIDGHGAKITADDTFLYNQGTCYGIFQFQVYAKNLTEFIVKNLDIDIKTNGILYGERKAGDERSCPIFRIKNSKIITIDNCNWTIASNDGNRAILYSDGVCDERVSITNSKFENKCAGNAGGVIGIRMKNDLKDITSFMANCSLSTDSCDELYSIQNTGASNLYSVIESCVFVNHGGFVNNNSTKKTIVMATNHTGNGKLYMNIIATRIEYDGKATNLMMSALRLTGMTQAHQNITLRGCIVSNPYGRAIESAIGEQGSSKYLHINAEKCDIVGGKFGLNDAINAIGDVIITDCNIEGESYVSYFYPLDYTNRFILKNSKIYLKNPKGILFVHNRKRHIVEICGNIYGGNYESKIYHNDTIDPNAPDIDLEVIQNNVYESIPPII